MGDLWGQVAEWFMFIKWVEMRTYKRLTPLKVLNTPVA